MRTVGPWAFAASIVNIVIGAGIFAVPSALAACVGPYAPLVFLVCGIAIGSVAICFAEGGSRVPTSGGAYATIEAAFGPLAGFVVGTLLCFSDALACGGVAAALADVAVTVLPPPIRSAAHVVVILGVIGGIAVVNLGSTTGGARFAFVATALKLVPLAVFVVAGASMMHASRFTQAVAPSSVGLGRAMILALFAFSGMETALCASGEVKDPARTIPRALVIAMFSVTALYVAIQVIAQGVLGDALARSTTPLADAMGPHVGLRTLMLCGAAVSMFGWVGSDLLGTPRIVMAFGRSGWLPRALGRVHPRTHVPHVAILAYAALTAGLALTGTFAELAVLSELGIAPLYIGGCWAAWKLARQGVSRAGEPLGFRFLGVAAVVGSASMVLMVALASRAEIVGLTALVALCVVAYLVRVRLARPA